MSWYEWILGFFNRKGLYSNEFWVSLIEKAYTKLYGSHSSKARGFFDDSLVDLTGLTSKKIVIDSDKMKNKN